MLAVSAPGGCQRSNLVEAELRTRERELRDIKDDLDHYQWQNEALVRELQAVRQGSGIPPELAAQTYTVKQITLGRGTGGYDDGHGPGDEGLQVVLEPKDGDGHTIKAPGALHVEAQEISSEGLKIPFSSWDVMPEQLRRTWRNGFISTGYFVVLPWKNWPSSERLRITARFLLSDGRQFEADKDLTIRLTPMAYRKPTSGPDLLGPPVPALPDGTMPLPAPRKVDPKVPSVQQSEWLPPPGSPSRVQPAVAWGDRPAASLADLVQFLPPQALDHQPGEEPE